MWQRSRLKGTRVGVPQTTAEPAPAMAPLESAREVTRIARSVIEGDSEADTGEMMGALLVSAGHAAAALGMGGQEFVTLASRCYAHAQRSRRANPA